MKHFSIRPVGVLALKVCFLAFGLLSVWLLCGIAENPSIWYIYLLAAFGSFSIACLLLGAALEAEDELDRADRVKKSCAAYRNGGPDDANKAG